MRARVALIFFTNTSYTNKNCRIPEPSGVNGQKIGWNYLFFNLSGKYSFSHEFSFQKRKLSPENEAKFYCQAGIDQDGFEKKLVSKFVGKGAMI